LQQNTTGVYQFGEQGLVYNVNVCILLSMKHVYLSDFKQIHLNI